jgi:hypothetical protein
MNTQTDKNPDQKGIKTRHECLIAALEPFTSPTQPGHAYFATSKITTAMEGCQDKVIDQEFKTVSADPRRTPNELKFSINAETKKIEEELKVELAKEFDKKYLASKCKDTNSTPDHYDEDYKKTITELRLESAKKMALTLLKIKILLGTQVRLTSSITRTMRIKT